MNIEEIKKIASRYHIKAGKAKKSDLVRAIQQAEGNQACFNSNKSATCGQDACMWRTDCT
jgi:hypothetical protein